MKNQRPFARCPECRAPPADAYKAKPDKRLCRLFIHSEGQSRLEMVRQPSILSPGPMPESQGRNLALTVLCVPSLTALCAPTPESQGRNLVLTVLHVPSLFASSATRRTSRAWKCSSSSSSLLSSLDFSDIKVYAPYTRAEMV